MPSSHCCKRSDGGGDQGSLREDEFMCSAPASSLWAHSGWALLENEGCVILVGEWLALLRGAL